MVYDGKNGILPISKGKSRDQIHSYLLKWLGIKRGCNSIEWGFLPVSDIFVLLACSTAFDVVSDPVVHLRPLVDFFCFSDRFVSARIFFVFFFFFFGEKPL